MAFETIDNAVKQTIIFGAVLSVILSFFITVHDSAAFFIGVLCANGNLLLIKHLIQLILPKTQQSYFKIIGLVMVKFPLLYLLAYTAVSFFTLPLITFLAGTALIFFVLLASGMRHLAKTSLFVLTVFSSSKIMAAGSIEGEVPEVPNIITFIHQWFKTPWAAFLHEWENVVFSLFMATVISIFFYLAARKQALIPSGIQNFVEWIVEVLRNFVVGILGPDGEKYVPLLGTLFVYILSMNWMALIPFLKAPTSSLSITAALAICVFVYVQYLNIRNWGFFGFLYHLAGSPKTPGQWLLVPLMFPIELLTQFTRPFTLALRLFGNIVGEDILIGAAALFGVYLLSSWNIVGGLPMQIPFMFLALLTGLMQALVFTLLTTIYILLSMPEEEKKA